MARDISNRGERVTIGNTWSYYAHLSIYRFASPYCRTGSRVLDAGCGTGYGAACLADHGACVLAYDAAAEAIAYARRTFPRVHYEVRDLGSPLPLADSSFDLVLSSNVFEHVPDVDRLAAECARVVKPDGAVIVAVPPVMDAEGAASDIRNHFHVHHIPPVAWHAKLSRFFREIECYDHHGAGKWREVDQELAEQALPPEQVSIRETDFEFPRVAAESHCRKDHPITALFVCRQPRDVALPETLAERMPAAWFAGAIVAGILQEEREAASARSALKVVLVSMSRRIMGPLRLLRRKMWRRVNLPFG
jgi:2-polyprenyl-3-methyl-5-hydroxy-6-metoxy-1,4-benzoquinol methylase